MTRDAFLAELKRLGWSQQACARTLGVGERTVRRWVAEDTEIPVSVALLLPKLTKSEAKKLLKDSSLNLPEVEG